MLALQLEADHGCLAVRLEVTFQGKKTDFCNVITALGLYFLNILAPSNDAFLQNVSLTSLVHLPS